MRELAIAIHPARDLNIKAVYIRLYGTGDADARSCFVEIDLSRYVTALPSLTAALERSGLVFCFKEHIGKVYM